MEHRFLTVAEVARLLRLSRNTVYRLVATGAIPAVRVGGGIRVPLAMLEARLAAQSTPNKN